MAELYLVEFKGSRKELFYNTYYHNLVLNDYVIVQAEQGEDIGQIIKWLEGRKDLPENFRPRSILRLAGQEDLDHFSELKNKENECKKDIIELIRKHGLTMKVVDVECQFDGNKITFYFTADHRVDFRSLVRDLASRYRTRIELRQIGVRDEARRNDGFGICGRRQCCNTFIKEFASISTAHAREQDLSLNPSKISGNCGRLLCCLKYEADSYVELRRRFPFPGSTVETNQGTGVIERIDYFKEEMVINGPENTIIRAGIKDLIKVLTTKEGQEFISKPLTEYTEEEAVGAEEKEALKRLDELENLN